MMNYMMNKNLLIVGAGVYGLVTADTKICSCEVYKRKRHV